MSIYIHNYLESQELYLVTVDNGLIFFDAYMTKSELTVLNCVSNPEKIKD